MSRRDPDRLLRAYLEEGVAELSDRAYDAVRATIDHKRQRVVIGPWREPRMTNFTRIAIAAAAVLIVGLLAFRLVPEPSSNVGGTPTATPTTGATVAPTRAPTVRDGPLEAGTYSVEPLKGIRYTLDVPEGWSGLGEVIVLTRGYEDPDGAALLFGAPGDITLNTDPCLPDDIIGPDGNPTSGTIPVGPSVDDFATALADHPLLDVTTPVDVELGGHAGKYVDIQVPGDISGCGLYRPWQPTIYAQGPGNQWHVWILDVAGQRVVVLAHEFPGTSADDKAELRAMVDSIRITTS